LIYKKKLGDQRKAGTLGLATRNRGFKQPKKRESEIHLFNLGEKSNS